MKKLFLFLAIALLAATARSDVIVFDTFGPGDTYNPANGYQIGLGGNMTESAAQFSPVASGDLATVSLGLLLFQGANPASAAVNVFLYGDAGGSPDNANQTFLGSISPSAIFDGVTNNSVVSFSVAGTVPVTMGSIYYLVVKPSSFGTDDAWMPSLPPVVGLGFVSHDDATWIPAINPFTLPAFRLTATSTVPDSGSAILLLFGSIGLLFALNFRKCSRPSF